MGVMALGVMVTRMLLLLQSLLLLTLVRRVLRLTTSLMSLRGLVT